FALSWGGPPGPGPTPAPVRLVQGRVDARGAMSRGTPGLVPVVRAGRRPRSAWHRARATPARLSRVRADLATRAALHGAVAEGRRRVRGAALRWVTPDWAPSGARVASAESSAPAPTPAPPQACCEVTARPCPGRARSPGDRVPGFLESALDPRRSRAGYSDDVADAGPGAAGAHSARSRLRTPGPERGPGVVHRRDPGTERRSP